MVYECGVFNVTSEGLGPQVGEGLEPIRVTAHCADLMPGFEKAACNLCSDPACCPGHDIGTLRVFHGSSSAFSRRTVTRTVLVSSLPRRLVAALLKRNQGATP